MLLLLWPAWSVQEAGAVASEPVSAANVTTQLVSARDAAVPGETLRLGLRLEHEPTWHTYWTNPGAAGLTTKLTWDVPAGVEVGEIDWPTPIKFGQELQIIGYGYEGEALLPVALRVPADFAESSVTVSVTVSYLSCAEVCIPGKASHTLTLPVVSSVGAASVVLEHAGWFARADAARPASAMPEAARGWRTGVGERFALALREDALGAAGFADGEAAEFLPAVLGQFDDLADQAVSRGVDESGAAWRVLTLTPEDGARPIDRVAGLVAWGPKDARRSVALDVAVGDEALALRAAWGAGLFTVLGSAVLGGLILNLMPCVFPVLALKISAFVGQAGESRGAVLRHGLAFGAGVLVSFWAIAAAVLVIKAGGQEIGWGFQLQNPIFVGVMAVLMFAIGLNFAGVFEIGIGVMNAAGKASGAVESQGGLAGSFGSGVLATALATPCSAPFLVTSVGYAMTAPAGVLVLVLTAMGVGMALPYVLLSAFPSWLKMLPRPGAWMETFKQLMSFPMFAVSAWLVWVFNGQAGASGAALGLPGMLAALLLVAMGLWALGRFGVPSRSVATRWAARLACGGLLLGSLATVAWAGRPGDAGGSLDWQAWSPEAVAAARAEGRPGFVNFTADWCTTCKFNERVFIDVADVRAAVADADVAVFKADWTSHDDRITAALAEFGVASVPYYVFYAPDDSVPPVHFDLVFSTGKILDALRRVTPDG